MGLARLKHTRHVEMDDFIKSFNNDAYESEYTSDYLIGILNKVIHAMIEHDIEE
jgi:hypothetical protein